MSGGWCSQLLLEPTYHAISMQVSQHNSLQTIMLFGIHNSLCTVYYSILAIYIFLMSNTAGTSGGSLPAVLKLNPRVAVTTICEILSKSRICEILSKSRICKILSKSRICKILSKSRICKILSKSRICEILSKSRNL